MVFKSGYANTRGTIPHVQSCEIIITIHILLKYSLQGDGVAIRLQRTRHVSNGDLYRFCPPAQVPALHCQEGASFNWTPQGENLTKTKWSNERRGGKAL